MQLRTTSQLQKLGDYPQPESLLEISQASGSGSSVKYYSKSIELGLVHDTIEADTTRDMVQRFKFRTDDTASGQDISLREQKQRLDNLTGTVQTSGRNTVFPGQKYFDVNPVVNSPAAALQAGHLPTVNQTKSLIKTNGAFIGQDASIYRSSGSAAPRNANGDRFTVDDNCFMHFRLEDSQRESGVQSYPAGSGVTGQLVCYGWMSDKGDVPAQNAWVALCGYIGGEPAGSEDPAKWVILQLQPWIIGTKSQSLQYVGFNVPYKAGLRLKIMTGFPVDGSSTGFQTGASLTLDSGWQPNTFIGYVLYY